MVETTTSMQPTTFQRYVLEKMRDGRSVLLIAPTGLGKTFAVTEDIHHKPCKTVYAVPLRALGGSVRQEISELVRENNPINAVIHHGDIQESMLFGEEVIVTTYDQVVCGMPGLPLSIPLKAGHAVAGALLMSRLILDEVHLAWGISDHALAILLAIIDFRKKIGLQTVVLTATLPDDVAKLISGRLGLDLVIVGTGELDNDEGLKLREQNREVLISLLELKRKAKAESKVLDYTELDNKLKNFQGKRIYFANTVDRLQSTFDRLTANGMDSARILVLHNRMPHSWRSLVEKEVNKRFGKGSLDGEWLLLTNQVAEAGLNISAPLVISDPAPVDTLVQRAGRCARWFRDEKTQGQFLVIEVPNNLLKEWATPYQEHYVNVAIKTLPRNSNLSWDIEREWINKAWGLRPSQQVEKRIELIEKTLDEMAFALNLFDRAAQEHKPGEIARVFREIVSAEIVVEDAAFNRDLQNLLDFGKRPDGSSVSLKRALQLLRDAKGTKVIRNEEGDLQLKIATSLQPGDILVVPSTVAYLHKIKGLCFGDKSKVTSTENTILCNEWKLGASGRRTTPHEGGQCQTLFDHAKGVMTGTYQRLTNNGLYRTTLVKILKSLEPEKDPYELANAIAQIATLAAGFHDLGKSDQKWQKKALKIDPNYKDDLIGRTGKTEVRIGIPHTSPGYLATLKACELLLGSLDSSEYLIRAIVLAAVRHHSSGLSTLNL